MIYFYRSLLFGDLKKDEVDAGAVFLSGHGGSDVPFDGVIVERSPPGVTFV